MPEPEIVGQGAPVEPTDPDGGSGDPAGGEKKPDTAPDDKLKALQEEVKSLKTLNGELTVSERYWAEQSKSGGAPAPAPKEEPDPLDALFTEDVVDDDSVDGLIDALTSEGAGALKKRGFVSKSDLKPMFEAFQASVVRKAEEIAEGKIGTARKSLEADGDLLREFPEFNQTNSTDPKVQAFISAASDQYKVLLARNPGRKDDPTALFDAGEYARLIVGQSSNGNQARIDAQGDPGKGSGGQDTGGGMSARQKKIAEAMGVTAEDYQKRANHGIQLKGMPMHGAMEQ